jgi:hypothetical protein
MYAELALLNESVVSEKRNSRPLTICLVHLHSCLAHGPRRRSDLLHQSSLVSVFFVSALKVYNLWHPPSNPTAPFPPLRLYSYFLMMYSM